SINAYQQAKQQIFAGDGVMVINRDDPIVNGMAIAGRNQIGFSLHASHGVDFGLLQQDGKTFLAEGGTALLDVSKMKIAGRHNMANALAALALGSAMALPITAMLEALQQFNGLPHRCRL